MPVKYEHVVFCGLSDFQLALYQLFITSPDIKALLRGKESQPLKAINVLKKLCNHPALLELPSDLKGSESLIPAGFVGVKERSTGGSGSGGSGPGVNCEWSGKFVVLERRVVRAWAIKVMLTFHGKHRFLHRIKTETSNKIVLISNNTQTLDMFEKMLRSKKYALTFHLFRSLLNDEYSYGYFRLDGGMAITKRQKCVDQFNDPERSEFVCLLSSKVGGCGINHIGANRLILFDPGMPSSQTHCHLL